MNSFCSDAPFPSFLNVPGGSVHACRFTYADQPLFLFDADRLGTIRLPAALRDAVPKRQAEFLAGRYCAVRAYGALTGRYPEIPIGRDRAPIWPADVVGSISHVDGYAVSVVVDGRFCQGVGIDVEDISASDRLEDIVKQVATRDEMAYLSHVPGNALHFTLMFSAKEAIFKALHPTALRFIDFNEVKCVGASLSEMRFKTEPTLSQIFPNGRLLTVLYAISSNRVFTLCRF